MDFTRPQRGCDDTRSSSELLSATELSSFSEFREEYVFSSDARMLRDDSSSSDELSINELSRKSISDDRSLKEPCPSLILLLTDTELLEEWSVLSPQLPANMAKTNSPNVTNAYFIIRLFLAGFCRASSITSSFGYPSFFLNANTLSLKDASFGLIFLSFLILNRFFLAGFCRVSSVASSFGHSSFFLNANTLSFKDTSFGFVFSSFAFTVYLFKEYNIL